MNDLNEDLIQLPSLGKILTEKLKKAGIQNARELRSLGAENTFLRLKALNQDACQNMLMALEGAIQGVRWHKLDIARKEELKAFFRMVEKNHSLPGEQIPPVKAPPMDLE